MKNSLGIILFVLYFIQYFFDLKFDFLEELQTQENYKRWSGLFLFILILSQWFLSFKRMSDKLKGVKKDFYIEIHKWVGVLLPLAFYIHSTDLGYAILLALSIVFFINISLGFFKTKDWLDKHPKFFNIWLSIHILLSVLVLFISGIHIWQVFYYS